MSDLDGREDFAEQLAEAAGAVIRPLFRAHGLVDDKFDGTGAGLGGYDPVTIADRAAEEAMRALIHQHYPEDGVEGEEMEDVPSSSGFTWVLDPIDGTRAFILGLPLWGTLIALNDGAKPIYGVLDQPYTGERWIGGLGRGGFRHKDGVDGLGTRATDTLADAMLMATHPSIFETRDEQSAFARLSQSVKMVRWGGDCYAYGLVASGMVDLVVEANLKPFDIQALIPIVEAAGGIITDWQGGPCHTGGQVVAAANAALHAQAMKLLNDD